MYVRPLHFSIPLKYEHFREAEQSFTQLIVCIVIKLKPRNAIKIDSDNMYDQLLNSGA